MKNIRILPLLAATLVFPLPGAPRDPGIAAGEPERLHKIFTECQRLSAGQRERAEEMLLAAASESSGFTATARALAHNRLGTFYHEEGRSLKAQHHYRVTLAGLESFGREYEPLLMRISVNLASSYLESGQTAKAEALALKFVGSESGRANIPDAARLLALLGSVATSRADDRQAESYYLRAKAIFDQQPDDAQSESRAMLLANLAKLYARAGRYTDAAFHAKAAMAALEKSPQASAGSTIAILGVVAKVFAAQGQFDEAETVFRRALATSESAFGDGHGLRADLLFDWAAMLRTQKRKREAQMLERRAKSIVTQSQRENLVGYTVDVGTVARR